MYRIFAKNMNLTSLCFSRFCTARKSHLLENYLNFKFIILCWIGIAFSKKEDFFLPKNMLEQNKKTGTNNLKVQLPNFLTC